MPNELRPALLLATDVFGITPEVLALAEALGAEATLVSPHRETISFRSEAEGYAAFVQAGGVAAYAAHVCDVLAAQGVSFDLALGFSAGASALWLCLAKAAPWLPKRAELYYGSRIREHADLTPRCPTRLVFAEREASFDPAALAQRIRRRNLQAEIRPGSAHGFMNPLSPGFNATLCATELTRLQTLLA